MNTFLQMSFGNRLAAIGIVVACVFFGLKLLWVVSYTISAGYWQGKFHAERTAMGNKKEEEKR